MTEPMTTTTQPTQSTPQPSVLSQAAQGATPPSQGQQAPVQNAGGGQAPQMPEWLNGQLPEDLKGDLQTLARFKSPVELAKSYVHLNRKRNDALAMPGEDAKPEEWDQFYSKLGRPEKPEAYELKAPEGVQASDDLLKTFREIAHKSGMTPKQAQAAFEAYHASNQAAEAAYKTKVEEALGGLKKEWGEKYDQEVGAAGAFIAEFADPEIQKFLDESGWGNYPPLIKLLSKAGKSLVEAPIHGNVAPQGQSAEKIKAEISSIRANPGFWDKFHPEHKLLVMKDDELHQQLYPGQSSA